MAKDYEGQGTQKEKAPGFGQESGLGDLLGAGLRYGIPLAYLGASHKQVRKLRRDMKPDLQAPQLMTGSVKDIPRPNFATPYNPDMGGSSLAEFMNNGLSRDSMQRSQEAEFEFKNAQNRQGQENQIMDRTNQQKIMQANVNNQEQLFNAQMAAQELLGYALPDRRQTVESIFHNVDRDVYNAGVLKDTKETTQAQEIIRFPDRYSPEQGNWARSVLSSTGMPVKRMGGKLKKTKFSVR